MDPELSNETGMASASDHPAQPGDEEIAAETGLCLTPTRTLMLKIRSRLGNQLLQVGKLIKAALLQARRHGHMAAGLVNLGYEAAFLLKATPFFSPALHCAGLTLVRDDGSATVRLPVHKRMLHGVPCLDSVTPDPAALHV